MNKLYVGLDLSLKDFKVSIIDQEGVVAIKPFAATNDLYGAEVLIDAIEDCCRRLSASTVFIGYESTSVYGWHIQHLLADCPSLKPYHPNIICFNPKSSKGSKSHWETCRKTITWMQIQLRKGLGSVDFPSPALWISGILPFKDLPAIAFIL